MRINCKLLVTSKEFVKCSDCHAPITNNLIASHTRFEEAFVGKAWSCQSKGCTGQKLHRKEQNNFWCSNCKVTMPILNYPRDLVYTRFSCKKIEKQSLLFREVLTLLPFIDEHRDFREMLANEIESLDDTHAMQRSQLELFA